MALTNGRNKQKGTRVEAFMTRAEVTEDAEKLGKVLNSVSFKLNPFEFILVNESMLTTLRRDDVDEELKKVLRSIVAVMDKK